MDTLRICILFRSLCPSRSDLSEHIKSAQSGDISSPARDISRRLPSAYHVSGANHYDSRRQAYPSRSDLSEHITSPRRGDISSPARDISRRLPSAYHVSGANHYDSRRQAYPSRSDLSEHIKSAQSGDISSPARDISRRLPSAYHVSGANIEVALNTQLRQPSFRGLSVPPGDVFAGLVHDFDDFV